MEDLRLDTSIHEIFDNLNELEKNLTKQVSSALKYIGKEIVKDTIKRTPVDTGDLENSIKYIIDGNDKVVVYSNSPYAVYLHEGIYNLGLKSQLKQFKQTEIVGDKFMERALLQEKDKYLRMIKSILSKIRI